jgi:hypothetical protein
VNEPRFQIENAVFVFASGPFSRKYRARFSDGRWVIGSGEASIWTR